jgi:hypothetical protein
MARLCVLICRIEDENAPDTLTQLQRVDLPAVDPQELPPAAALDQLETQAVTSGQEVMRHLLGHQWQIVEEQLTAAALRLSPPEHPHRRRGRSLEGR